MSKVIYEKRKRVAYVTLNRPKQKNAIDREMHELLAKVWKDFCDDESADVAILTGAGDAFCARMDLKTFVPEVVGANANQVRKLLPLGLGGITRGLHRIHKPVIAAVNGWALAAGFELALAADIRVASENAKFGSFEARRGFHHGDGGIPRLVNMVGVGAALELVLTACPIDAYRACQMNLLSTVVPHDELLEQAEAVASEILRNDQAALHSAKATILDMVGRSLDDQLRIEAVNGYSCMANGVDVKKRLQAFYDKHDRAYDAPNPTHFKAPKCP
jgi:enoyl-CoA hydratase/carnithine racemase